VYVLRTESVEHTQPNYSVPKTWWYLQT